MAGSRTIIFGIHVQRNCFWAGIRMGVEVLVLVYYYCDNSVVVVVVVVVENLSGKSPAKLPMFLMLIFTVELSKFLCFCYKN